MAPVRRSFLKLAAGAATVGALPFTVLRTRSAAASSPWGPLVPDPNGVIDLPDGFCYRILERAGEPMDDGYVVPGRPDGMGCFVLRNGDLALMRNHELSPGSWSLGPYPAEDEPLEVYDAGSVGGVSRLVVDPVSFSRVSSNLVLAGTNRNCAGGWSPWGWLSCEENLSVGHGYVFVCDAEAESLQKPNRKRVYGRFNHEAAVVHPDTLVCYLTEDSTVSSFYRFVPDDLEDPFSGTLQALRVIESSVFQTSEMEVGDRVDIDWVDIDYPDAGGGVHIEAQNKGAAVFRRGEGLAIFRNDVWICATSGGPVGRGQIFQLRDDGGERGQLKLVAHSDDPAVLDMPDNICISPTGTVFMAEDGSPDQFIRFIDGEGQVRDFARNAISSSEFAGACFSPDGDALFVNIQGDGLTLVITGPFDEPGRALDCGADGNESDGGGTESGEGSDGGTAGWGTTSGGPTTASGGFDGGVGDDAGFGGALDAGEPVLSSSCACSEGASTPDAVATLAVAAAVVVCRSAGERSRTDPDDDAR